MKGSPGMTINQLRYLVVLDAEKSFSEAASKLYISQQALSSSIKGIEKELNTQLFVRNRWHGVFTTPEGQLVIQTAKHILNEYYRLNIVLKQRAEKGKSVSGKIHVLYNGAFLVFGLPAYIEGFKPLYPDVKFSMSELDTGLIVKELQSGSHEHTLGIVSILKPDLEKIVQGNDSLQVRSLGETRFYMTCRKSSRFASYSKITVQTAITLPLAIYCSGVFEESPLFHLLSHYTNPFKLNYFVTDNRSLWLNYMLSNDVVSLNSPEFLEEKDLTDITLIPLKEDLSMQKAIIYPRDDLILGLFADYICDSQV